MQATRHIQKVSWLTVAYLCAVRLLLPFPNKLRAKLLSLIFSLDQSKQDHVCIWKEQPPSQITRVTSSLRGTRVLMRLGVLSDFERNSAKELKSMSLIGT